MDKEKVAIVYVSSDLYSKLAGTSIFSLYTNNKDREIDVYVVSMGITAENKYKLKCIGSYFDKSIYFIDGTEVENEIKKLKVPKYFDSYGIYVRPMVTELIPQKGYDVVISMDCDTIINRSLDILIEKTINLSEEKAVILARNSDSEKARRNNGMFENDISINPGVMFINKRNWKYNQCTRKMFDFFEKYDVSKYKTLDEPVYGIALRGHMEVAGFNEIYYPCYGDLSGRQLLFMYGLKEKNYYTINEIEQAKGNEVVLHYVNILGHPWELGCKAPLSSIWQDYYKQTPFFEGGGRNRFITSC